MDKKVRSDTMEKKNDEKIELCIQFDKTKKQLTFDDIMNFWPGNQYHYQELKEEIEEVVPLVGAGLTQNIVKDGEEDYLAWKELLEKCANKIGGNTKTIIKWHIDKGEYEEAAQEVVNIIGKNTLLSLIKAQYDPKKIDRDKLENNPIKVFPLLFDELILTTNYDKVIESVFEDRKQLDLLLPSACKRDFVDVLRKKKKGCILYKFHGDIEKSLEDIILTKDSYDKNYGERNMMDEGHETELVRNLSFCLLTHPVLFLGCGLKKDRIMDLIVKNKEVHHFAFVACGAKKIEEFDVEKAAQEAIKKNNFLDKNNIHAIFYPRYDRSCIKKLLDELLMYKNQISKDGRYYQVFQVKKDWMHRLILNLNNPKRNAIKKHIVIFGGIFTEIREYEKCERAKQNIDNLNDWLQNNKDGKIFICYDSEDAALFRSTQTEKNISERCILEKIKHIRMLPEFFKEEVKHRVYLIPITYSLTGYSVLTDSELYWNIITQSQSAEGPILKIIEEFGESGLVEKSNKLGYMIYALQESKNILENKMSRKKRKSDSVKTFDPVLDNEKLFENAMQNIDSLKELLSDEQVEAIKLLKHKADTTIKDKKEKIGHLE